MRTIGLMTGALAVSLLGTGCVATHKYVAKTVAPVEQRVGGTEAKNTEQDQKLTAQAGQLEAVDRDLSSTKERLTDTDAKAAAAANAARQANDAARQADSKAQGAQQAADGAKGSAMQAQQNVDRLGRNVDGMLKYKMAKSDVVLFKLGQKTLDTDAKTSLDDFAKSVDGQDRFMIEVQGFTDKTGDLAYNETLSQERAEAVARYLANEHNIPLHNVTLLGSGIAPGDQKTRDERKMNRKVEIRLLVPEVGTATNTAQN
jgi:outer membrane protein OmpA-like peptidoglycan-associated protein